MQRKPDLPAIGGRARTLAIGIGAVLALSLGAGAAIAQSDAIDQRKALMKSNLKAIITISKAVKAGGTLDAASLGAAATSIRDAAPNIVGLFPKGSDAGMTNAKAEIWQDMARFEGFATGLQQGAAAFAAAASAGTLGDGKALLGGIGKNCGGCHMSFRKPLKQ